MKVADFADGNKREFRDEVVEINKLAIVSPVIADKDFSGCNILGPAFILIQNDVSIVGCSFASPEVFIPFSRLQVEQVFGVVVVTNVSFASCRFDKVNFLLPDDAYTSMIGNYEGAASENPE